MDDARFFFTDRHGGTSAAPYATLNLGGGVGDDPAAVAANRATVAERAGVPAERLVFMRQTHSRVVHTVVVGESVPSGVDGIVTAERGVALAVLVADCVPILARDPVAGVIAAAHAGRVGAAAGIALADHRGDGRPGRPPGPHQRRARAGRLRSLLRGARRHAGRG